MVNANGTHAIEIILQDKSGETKEYKTHLIIVKKPEIVIKEKKEIKRSIVESDVRARIIDFNLFGELKIEFTKVMFTDYNITHLNKTISHLGSKGGNSTIDPKLVDLMNIYVKPTKNWYIYTEGFEMQ